MTESPQDQENKQRAHIGETSSSRKRKRNKEHDTLPNNNIESTVEKSFYFNINQIMKKNNKINKCQSIDHQNKTE